MFNSENIMFFLLNRKKEKITISKRNNTIMYEISKKFSIQPSNILIENVKIFDVSLDSDDRIHLVCTTDNGQLYYFKYDNSWSREIMKSYSPLSNNIENINIISLKNTVHIFYSFYNIINKNLKRIVHLYKMDNKWKYIFLDNVYIKEKAYLIDYNNSQDKIYLLSKSEEGKKVKFKVREYLLKKNTWRLHPKITFNINIGDITFFLVDLNGNYHLLASDKNNSSSTYYIFKNPNSVTVNYKLFKNEKKSVQSLLEVEDVIYYISKSNNSIKYSITSDFGHTWSNKEEYNLESIYYIHILSESYQSIKLYRKISSLGYYYKENFYILGFNKPFYVIPQEEEKKIDTESYLPLPQKESDEVDRLKNQLDAKDDNKIEEHDNSSHKSFLQKIIEFFKE